MIGDDRGAVDEEEQEENDDDADDYDDGDGMMLPPAGHLSCRTVLRKLIWADRGQTLRLNAAARRQVAITPAKPEPLHYGHSS